MILRTIALTILSWTPNKGWQCRCAHNRHHMVVIMCNSQDSIGQPVSDELKPWLWLVIYSQNWPFSQSYRYLLSLRRRERRAYICRSDFSREHRLKFATKVAPTDTSTVSWMKRSGIRDCLASKKNPDFVSLHPGYATGSRQGAKNAKVLYIN